jgi:hypothetical protein
MFFNNHFHVDGMENQLISAVGFKVYMTPELGIYVSVLVSFQKNVRCTLPTFLYSNYKTRARNSFCFIIIEEKKL